MRLKPRGLWYYLKNSDMYEWDDLPCDVRVKFACLVWAILGGIIGTILAMTIEGVF